MVNGRGPTTSSASPGLRGRIGGTSIESHRAGLEPIYQTGAVPVSWTQLICELQRDYSRTETVDAFMQILFDPHVPFVAAEHR